MTVKILDGEYWWFGQVNNSHKMPVTKDSVLTGSMTDPDCCDQFAPFAFSSKGRYIHSDAEFEYEVKDGTITISGKGKDSAKLHEGYETLRGAYLAAKDAYMEFSGKLPDTLFLEKPQYNTWIELNVNQTQEEILEYAKSIIENGLPAGVLMIDNGWQEDFGTFEFNARKIPDPKYLMDTLHDMGFKVMLWVSPIIACAGKRYVELWDKGYLIKETDKKPVIRNWWDGYSAVLDFSNPDACKWYCDQLDSIMSRYGVDGFKFDAGDIYFYDDKDITFGNVSAREQTRLFNLLGEKYPFNEFRAAWNCSGRAIVARLQDKNHSWDNDGFNKLIPHTVAQGLSGYTFCCPDMVGGGAEGSTGRDAKLDSELFVRWAQANALMGMMQISLGFWKIFDKETVDLIINAVKLHESVCDYCTQLARESAVSGEPIVRSLDYQFPNQGYEAELSMYMLGDRYLAAPILEKGKTEREVRLPEGFRWKNDKGEIFEGGTVVTENVPIDRILYYEKI